MIDRYSYSQSERGLNGDERMRLNGCDTCSWVTRRVYESRDSHQSPKPAFFTVDMPTLDGGEGRRVGVLSEK